MCVCICVCVCFCAHVCLYACVHVSELVSSWLYPCVCVSACSLILRTPEPASSPRPAEFGLVQPPPRPHLSPPFTLSLSLSLSLFLLIPLSSRLLLDQVIVLSPQRSVCKKGGALRARQLRTLANQFVCGWGEGKEVGRGGLWSSKDDSVKRLRYATFPPENNVMVATTLHHLNK